MLDTVVSAIPHDVAKTSTYVKELNGLLHTFLPLSRREELLDYERDQRVRLTMVLRFIHDWVLEGIRAFLSESLRLLDVLEAGRSARHATLSIVEEVYKQAVIVGDRCRSARNQTADIARIYTQLGTVFKLYSENPAPKVDLESQDWKDVLAGLVARPTVSSPETFQQIMQLNDQICVTSEQLNKTMANLTEYFGALTKQFNPDELNPSWAAGLNAQTLREQWRRLGEEIGEGEKIIMESEIVMSCLPVPLQF